jgi:hypothetical protein
MAVHAPETPPEKRYRMRVHRNEFLSEYDGLIPAGAVVIVSESTAIRWMEHGIADPAPADAKTHREQKREDMRARLEASGSETDEGVYTAAITRESFRDERPIMPSPMPRGRRGKAARADLDGATVVNAQAEDLGDEDEV